MLEIVQQQQQEIIFLPIKVVVEAPHISLRSMHPDFAPFVHSEYTSDISECMYRKTCTEYIDTKFRIFDDIEEMMQGTLSSFVCCENTKGNPVGVATLHHKKASPKIDLWIAEKYQKRRYGTEAVLALKTYAKRHLPPHQYLTAMVSKHNVAAKKLFESKRINAELQPHVTFKANEVGQEGFLVTYRLYH